MYNIFIEAAALGIVAIIIVIFFHTHEDDNVKVKQCHSVGGIAVYDLDKKFICLKGEDLILPSK